MDAVLVGLIWLLIYALGIALVCYIVVRLASMFIPNFERLAWIVWCIGGLVLLVIAIRTLLPALGA